VIAATVVAAVLRFFRLGAQSLWIDEVLTWASANPGGPLSARDLLENVHGPLYALIVHAAAAVAPRSEWALRLPSALAGVLAVPALAWLAARWLGRSCAGWAAWLAACSPFWIWYSQEARPYAMLMLMVCVSGALVLGAARDAGRPRVLAAASASAAGLLVAPSFAFVLPVHLRWWLEDRAARARRLRTAGLGALLLVALGLPWGPQALRTWDWQRLHPLRAAAPGEASLRGTTTFHAAAIPFALHAFAVGYTLGPSLRELRASPGPATLARHTGELLAVAAVFGTLGVLALGALRRRRRLGDALLWAGFPALIVTWFALSNFKVFHPRYLAAASPAFLLALAAALTDLKPRARVVFAAAVGTLWAASLWQHYAVPAYGKEDLRGAARLVSERATAGERVLAVNSIDPMLYYYRGAAPLAPFWLGFAADPQRLGQKLAEAMSGRGTWLVLSRAEDLDPEGHFASLMASRHPDAERFEFEGVKVWHVRGAETAPPGSGPR